MSDDITLPHSMRREYTFERVDLVAIHTAIDRFFEHTMRRPTSIKIHPLQQHACMGGLFPSLGTGQLTVFGVDAFFTSSVEPETIVCEWHDEKVAPYALSPVRCA